MDIVIKNGTTTAIIKSYGAELASFKRVDGVELLWQGDPEYWSGQAPILFPIVGALRNGKTVIEDQWYEISKHGFARNSEFQVVEQTEDSVTLVLESTEETRKMYPFKFRLSVIYTVGNCALETKFIVKNIGDTEMPFVIGGHPAYNIPIESGEKFEEYSIVFEQEEDTSCPYVDMNMAMLDDSKVAFELKQKKRIPLVHDLFKQDALIFDELKSKTVSLIHNKTGKGIQMNIQEFPMLGIWSSVKEAPYVALEPWVGCASRFCESDQFVEKKNMQFLQCGKGMTYTFTTKYF
ncbi:MAG: aldose 1-epimerase family protein [Eubacteriales bacterium]